MRVNEVSFQILKRFSLLNERENCKQKRVTKEKPRDMSREPNGEKEGRLLLSFLNNSSSD